MSTTDDQNPDGPITPANQPEADDVILSEETAVLGATQVESGSTRTQHDLAAAYVLDALTQDERAAFEAHIVDCIDCEQRIAELKRVADLLPNALIVPPSELPDAYPFLLRDVAHETLPITSTLPSALAESDDDEPEELDPITPDAEPETVTEDEPDGITPVTLFEETDLVEDAPEPVIVEAVAEEIEADEPVSDLDEEPLQIAPSRPVRQPRPPGRIRPGIRPPGGPAVAVANQRVALRATPTVIAFSLLGLIAVGLFLWALLLQGRINDLEGDVDSANAQLADIRENANATSYTLVPTTEGPQGATGTFFFSLPDQRGALTVRGLTAPPSGQSYQIWYIDEQESDPIAGPTFAVNSAGEAAVPLNLNAATFDAIAISLEPTDGSDQPSTDYLLEGQLGGAAG
ncbi:hypothetical protein BH09CHL1_BH09CHL1_02420 [soil metagenome]